MKRSCIGRVRIFCWVDLCGRVPRPMYNSVGVQHNVDLWLIYKSTSALFSICIQSYIVAFIVHIRIYICHHCCSTEAACMCSVNRSGLFPVFLMWWWRLQSLRYTSSSTWRDLFPYPNARSLSLPFFAFQSSLHHFDALA